jgi:hypothetical protein
MKKLINLIAIALICVSSSFSQTKKSEKATKAKSTTVVHVKKDGTADMRYKENKAAKTEGPKKKDGTADMR